MSSIEQTGKTIEEATQLALDELGVTEDQVDVEILDEGSRGFLGLGQAPAKVRVTMRGTAQSEERAEPAVVAEQPREPIVPETQTEISESTSPEAAAEICRDILQHIVDGIGSGGRVEVAGASDGQISLDIVGGDSSILIGKRGQTINALQYLLGVIVNRHMQHRYRVSVDAEGYRARREDALRSQARYLAEKVRESGQEAVLESLDASERRIIHTTLADDSDVYTYSEGTEPDRYVVISPKK